MAPVAAVPAIVRSAFPKTTTPLAKLILTVPVSVWLSPIVAAPPLKVPKVFVKPELKTMLAAVVTVVEVHVPVELCVTGPVKEVMPPLLLSLNAPVPVMDVVPVTVRLPVVLTVSNPVRLKFLTE